MSWRPAKSLLVLRDQVNRIAPARDRSSDGTIAGAEHHRANPSSDHEADNHGVVHAIDITNDPRHGINSRKLAEAIADSRDPRIKYLISNRQILSATVSPYKWRSYDGRNPHTEHMHLSVVKDERLCDSEKPWDLTKFTGHDGPPAAPDRLRLEMAKRIVDFEARRDAAGHLAVYMLPKNDGGGSYEVAGINERYNPKEAAQLKYLVQTRQYNEAEAYAQAVILKDTDGATQWTQDPGVEFTLRDCIFNRGLRGAAMIMQHELGVDVDGSVGPKTRQAIETAEKNPVRRLQKLREAREWYERNKVGYRANFWRGLVNRWDKVLVASGEIEKIARA